MSAAAIVWAAKVQCPDPISKAILMHFAVFHNGKTGQCNPPNEAMVARSQFDKRTIKSAIKRLEKSGLLGHVGSKSGGRSTPIMRVLLADESAGVKAYEQTLKGGARRTPSESVKGYIRQTPFSASSKGVHQMYPALKGKEEVVREEGLSQGARLSGAAS